MEKHIQKLEKQLIACILDGVSTGSIDTKRARELAGVALEIVANQEASGPMERSLVLLEQYPEFSTIVEVARKNAEGSISDKQWYIEKGLHVALSAIDGIATAKKTLQAMWDGTLFLQEEKILGKKNERPDMSMVCLGEEEIFQMLRGEKQKEVGNGQQRKIGVVLLGGAQAGCVSAGLLQGMADVGVLDRVDGFFGVSAGALVAMYVAAGNGLDGARIVFEDNTRDDFIMLSKNRKEASAHLAKLLMGEAAPVIDTTAFARRATTTRPLDIEKLINLEKDVYVVVTNVDTGKPEYINISGGYIVTNTKEVEQLGYTDFLKTHNNILQVMSGSVCVPVLSTEPYTTMENGAKYADGGITDFVPLQFAYSQGYTDLLVLSNCPLQAETNIMDVFLYGIIAQMAKNQGLYPEAFVLQCKQLISNRVASLRYMEDLLADTQSNELQRVAVIAPEVNTVGLLEKDGDLLKKVYEHCRLFSQNLFASGDNPLL